MPPSIAARLSPLLAGDPRHGKRSSFTNHGCRCFDCRAAERTYRQELKARKARAGTPVCPIVVTRQDDYDARVHAIRPTATTIEQVYKTALSGPSVLDGSLREEVARTVLAHPTMPDSTFIAWDMVSKSWYFRHGLYAPAMCRLALDLIDLVAAQR